MPDWNQFSGPKLDKFREGWAVPMFMNGCKGHYFKRAPEDISIAVSACGKVVAPANQLFGLGTYAACSHCRRKHPVLNNTETFLETA